MKRFGILFLLLILCFSVSAQEIQVEKLPAHFPLEQLLRTGQREYFQPLIMPYFLGLCTTISNYDALGMDMYYWEDSREWQLMSNWTFTYEGDLISGATSSYEDMEQIYTNTIEAGKITETLIQMDIMGNLMDISRYFYNYEGDLLSSWLAQDSDYFGGWIDYQQGFYTYTDGLMTEYQVQNWLETYQQWENLHYYTVTYSGQDITEMLQESWNGAWQNHYLSEYTYSGSQLDIVMNYIWDDPDWLYDLKESYTYEADLPITILIEEWQGDTWGNFEMINNYFDGDVLDEVISEEWVGGEWHNLTWTDYVYSSSAEDEMLPITDIDLSNYPNPFNPETTISFSLPAGYTQNVDLKIYNIKGQLIRSFEGHPACLDEVQYPERRQELIEGRHSITWNGKDQAGNRVSSGIYYYKLEAGAASKIKKMLLLQ